MKKSKKVLNDLGTVIEHTLERLLDSVIIMIGKQYVIFNKYSITRTDKCILVFRRSDHLNIEFERMKHAMIWIMLDHTCRYSERDRIKFLDSALSSVDIDKKIHEKLKTKNRNDTELFLLYKTKIDIDKRKEKRIIAEIDKYFKMANTISHIQGNKK